MADLKWVKPDEFHIATECGSYAVSRVNRGAQVLYIAWRRPYTELGHMALASIATEEEKVAAIRAMRLVCQQHQEGKK